MMWLVLLLLGCKGPVDTGPVDTGELEKCELDLDSPWSFVRARLPFEAAVPHVAVVADRLVLAGGYYADPRVEEVHVGTTNDQGMLSGWEVLTSVPEGAGPFAGRTLPASPSRLVLYGGGTATECRAEVIWADFDGETLGLWTVDESLPEPVVDSAGITTQGERLLVLGGNSCSRPGEFGGCWTTTLTGAGPSTWEPIPCMGSIDSPRIAATGRTIHVAGLFLDEENYGNGFASARLVDGIPQEWEMGRSPASTGMGNLAVAEGYLFTGPAQYRSGEHTGTAVLYSDADEPFGWQYLPDLPLELSGGSMVAHNGFLYIMGGTDPALNRLDQVFSRPICAGASEE